MMVKKLAMALLVLPTFAIIYGCGGGDSKAQDSGLFIIERPTVTFSCPVEGQTGALECPENSIIVGAGCDVNTLDDNIELTVKPIITSLFQVPFTVTQANNCDLDCTGSPVAGDVEITPFAVCLQVGS